MTRLNRPRAALAVFVAGVALMLVFEATVTRVAGVALMLAGIVLGVFAIATDEFVAGDETGDP